eukprot:1159518-Pelagomonas_calceolata.AAC.9
MLQHLPRLVCWAHEWPYFRCVEAVSSCLYQVEGICSSLVYFMCSANCSWAHPSTPSRPHELGHDSDGGAEAQRHSLRADACPKNYACNPKQPFPASHAAAVQCGCDGGEASCGFSVEC